MTNNQRDILEQMAMLGSCIVFDSDDGIFAYYMPMSGSYFGNIHPATACALIQKKYIEAHEKDRTAFYLTDEGISIVLRGS